MSFKFMKKLIILLPVFLLFFSIPVSAAGSVIDYDGSVSLLTPNTYLHLYTDNILGNSNSAYITVYDASLNNTLVVDDLTPGTLLSGTLYFPITFTPYITLTSPDYYNYCDVYFTSDLNLDNISLSYELISRNSGVNTRTAYYIKVFFDGYLVTSSKLEIPFLMNISQTVHYGSESVQREYVIVSSSTTGDWAGDISIYTDPSDFVGTSSLDLSPVINAINSQTDQVNQDLQAQIQATQDQSDQAHADSQAQKRPHYQ